ncbi:P-loop containing nucleoside triphosphate hydrolase protein [Calocera cornea HHB12733]|uniref:p-loop containing nucleoside triphosphate hydrolase protein n=1 Tax=Calocera cornea HHB12733 TaxID=1353952 RepID=A0A165CVD3_9BASI|nr:P-loop containing nucleoside triphosphate hydrolase protein [Calocera cornea HHB12733]
MPIPDYADLFAQFAVLPLVPSPDDIQFVEENENSPADHDSDAGEDASDAASDATSDAASDAEDDPADQEDAEEAARGGRADSPDEPVPDGDDPPERVAEFAKFDDPTVPSGSDGLPTDPLHAAPPNPPASDRNSPAPVAANAPPDTVFSLGRWQQIFSVLGDPRVQRPTYFSPREYKRVKLFLDQYEACRTAAKRTRFLKFGIGRTKLGLEGYVLWKQWVMHVNHSAITPHIRDVFNHIPSMTPWNVVLKAQGSEKGSRMPRDYHRWFPILARTLIGSEAEGAYTIDKETVDGATTVTVNFANPRLEQLLAWLLHNHWRKHQAAAINQYHKTLAKHDAAQKIWNDYRLMRAEEVESDHGEFLGRVLNASRELVSLARHMPKEHAVSKFAAEVRDDMKLIFEVLQLPPAQRAKYQGERLHPSIRRTLANLTSESDVMALQERHEFHTAKLNAIEAATNMTAEEVELAEEEAEVGGIRAKKLQELFKNWTGALPRQSQLSAKQLTIDLGEPADEAVPGVLKGFRRFLHPDGLLEEDDPTQWEADKDRLIPLAFQHHQLEAVDELTERLIRNESMALFDEVGYGKTMVSMGVITKGIEMHEAFEKRKKFHGRFVNLKNPRTEDGNIPNLPWLIILPPTLIDQVRDEFRRMIGPNELDIFEYQGSLDVHKQFFGPGMAWETSKMPLIRRVILASSAATSLDARALFGNDKTQRPLYKAQPKLPLYDETVKNTIFNQKYLAVIDPAYIARWLGIPSILTLAREQTIAELEKDIARARAHNRWRVKNDLQRMEALEWVPHQQLLEMYRKDYTGRVIRRTIDTKTPEGKPIIDLPPYVTIEMWLNMTKPEEEGMKKIWERTRSGVGNEVLPSLIDNGGPFWNEYRAATSAPHIVTSTDSSIRDDWPESVAAYQQAPPSKLDGLLTTILYYQHVGENAPPLRMIFRDMKEFHEKQPSRLVFFDEPLYIVKPEDPPSKYEEAAEENHPRHEPGGEALAPPLRLVLDRMAQRPPTEPELVSWEELSPATVHALGDEERLAYEDRRARRERLLEREQEIQNIIRSDQMVPYYNYETKEWHYARKDPPARIAVYQHFSSQFHRTTRILNVHGIKTTTMHGKMGMPARRESVQKWRDSTDTVLIMSSVASVGLNMSEGKVMIILDPMWSAQSLRQTIGRFWRRPQKLIVHVVHLLLRGTIEPVMHRGSRGRARLLQTFLGTEALIDHAQGRHLKARMRLDKRLVRHARKGGMAPRGATYEADMLVPVQDALVDLEAMDPDEVLAREAQRRAAEKVAQDAEKERKRAEAKKKADERKQRKLEREQNKELNKEKRAEKKKQREAKKQGKNAVDQIHAAQTDKTTGKKGGKKSGTKKAGKAPAKAKGKAPAKTAGKPAAKKAGKRGAGTSDPLNADDPPEALTVEGRQDVDHEPASPNQDAEIEPQAELEPAPVTGKKGKRKNAGGKSNASRKKSKPNTAAEEIREGQAGSSTGPGTAARAGRGAVGAREMRNLLG